MRSSDLVILAVSVVSAVHSGAAQEDSASTPYRERMFALAWIVPVGIAASGTHSLPVPRAEYHHQQRFIVMSQQVSWPVVNLRGTFETRIIPATGAKRNRSHIRPGCCFNVERYVADHDKVMSPRSLSGHPCEREARESARREAVGDEEGISREKSPTAVWSASYPLDCRA